MQIKLKRREDIAISSSINGKNITNSEWDVYSQEDVEDTLVFLLRDKTGNHEVKFEIKKVIPYEMSETPKE